MLHGRLLELKLGLLVSCGDCPHTHSAQKSSTVQPAIAEESSS
jgi:hypothetical protein